MSAGANIPDDWPECGELDDESVKLADIEQTRRCDGLRSSSMFLAPGRSDRGGSVAMATMFTWTTTALSSSDHCTRLARPVAACATLV